MKRILIVLHYIEIGCARGIVDLINSKARQEEIIEYLKTHDYGNEAEVEKLYGLL